MDIRISTDRNIIKADIINLYKKNQWSSAEKPQKLYDALINSHSLVSAWDQHQLVGIGNSISDGFLVVYYPHLLVDPDYHGRGIGRMIMEKMKTIYNGFHMHMLTADKEAIPFYQKLGFSQAGNTMPMWIYQGNEH